MPDQKQINIAYVCLACVLGYVALAVFAWWQQVPG